MLNPTDGEIAFSNFQNPSRVSRNLSTSS